MVVLLPWTWSPYTVNTLLELWSIKVIWYIYILLLEVILKNLEKINEIDNLDVYILSLARSFIIVEEKKQWLKKYAPFIREENYILLNKENGDYNAENREFIKSIKMMEKLNEYDYVILLDDDHKILKRTLNEVGKNGEVFHVSSATM